MKKLFLGIKGHVVCLDKESGDVVWDTKVKNSAITNVYYEDGLVFAYSGGHLFCLHSSDGSLKWENTLKGLGYGACIMASEQQNSALIMSQIAAQQAAAGTTVAVTATSSSS